MVDILLSFPKEFFIIIISSTIQVGLQICQPFLVQEIITFLESPTAPMNIGYGLLGGFLCVSIGTAVNMAPLKRFDHRLTKAAEVGHPLVLSLPISSYDHGSWCTCLHDLLKASAIQGQWRRPIDCFHFDDH